MKFLLTFIALISIHVTVAQKEITTTKTADHIQVPGTKFFLIPPPDFTNATNFQGFQQMHSGSSIMVMEVPGPFSEASTGFTAEALKTKGVILKKKEVLKINGFEGMLIRAEQFANGIDYFKYILTFGNEQTSYMLMATFPQKVKFLEKEMLESLYSVVYEAELTVDPLSAISFSIDTEGTKLQFAKSISGMLSYTVDGKLPTASDDKTNFIVGISYASVQSIDKKLTALNRVKQLPYNDLKIADNGVSEIEIDGISGYEIVAEGTNSVTGAKDLVYQVMLFSDNGYYMLVGIAKADFETNLVLFKQIAKTFERK